MGDLDDLAKAVRSRPSLPARRMPKRVRWLFAGIIIGSAATAYVILSLRAELTVKQLAPLPESPTLVASGAPQEVAPPSEDKGTIVLPSAAGKWKVSCHTNQIDGKTVAVFSVDAEQAINAAEGPVRPTLVVEMGENDHFNVYVKTGIQPRLAVSTAYYDTTIGRIRYGNESARITVFRTYGDGTVSLCYNDADEGPYKRIGQCGEIAIEITPIDGPPVSMSFDVRNLKDALLAAADAIEHEK